MSTFYGAHTRTQQHRHTHTHLIFTFKCYRNYMKGERKKKRNSRVQCTVHSNLYIQLQYILLRKLFSFQCVCACKLSQNVVPINGIVTEKNICTFKHFHFHMCILTHSIGKTEINVVYRDQPIGKLFSFSRARANLFTHHHHNRCCCRQRISMYTFAKNLVDVGFFTLKTVNRPIR